MKEKYLKLLENLNVNPDFKSALTKFIDTYNGTNDTETTNLMNHLFAFLYSVEALNIKANAFDKIEKSYRNLEETLQEIDEDMDIVLKDGDLPRLPDGF